MLNSKEKEPQKNLLQENSNGSILSSLFQKYTKEEHKSDNVSQEVAKPRKSFYKNQGQKIPEGSENGSFM